MLDWMKRDQADGPGHVDRIGQEISPLLGEAGFGAAACEALHGLGGMVESLIGVMSRFAAFVPAADAPMAMDLFGEATAIGETTRAGVTLAGVAGDLGEVSFAAGAADVTALAASGAAGAPFARGTVDVGRRDADLVLTFGRDHLAGPGGGDGPVAVHSVEVLSVAIDVAGWHRPDPLELEIDLAGWFAEPGHPVPPAPGAAVATAQAAGVAESPGSAALLTDTDTFATPGFSTAEASLGIAFA